MDTLGALLLAKYNTRLTVGGVRQDSLSPSARVGMFGSDLALLIAE